MSYKENLKNPARKLKMIGRRGHQRAAEATPPRPRVRLVHGILIPFKPKKPNKYTSHHVAEWNAQA